MLYRSGGQSVVGMASAALGIALAIAGLLVPLRLTQLNRTWHKLSSILASVMNPLVLTVLYVTTILPAALLMRGLRRDPLRLKIDPTAKSYWVERTPPGPARDSMRDQF